MAQPRVVVSVLPQRLLLLVIVGACLRQVWGLLPLEDSPTRQLLANLLALPSSFFGGASSRATCPFVQVVWAGVVVFGNRRLDLVGSREPAANRPLPFNCRPHLPVGDSLHHCWLAFDSQPQTGVARVVAVARQCLGVFEQRRHFVVVLCRALMDSSFRLPGQMLDGRGLRWGCASVLFCTFAILREKSCLGLCW
jgi:hypothetical protein